MRKFALIFILISVIFGACKKDESLGNVPEITLIKAGPDQIKVYEDSVYFSIAYKDGDGDLGDPDPLVKNLFVEDHRIDLTYAYRISELVPGSAAVGIQGELNFSIANTVLTSSNSSETVYYRVWVVDRAGHRSNTLVIGPLTTVQ